MYVGIIATCCYYTRITATTTTTTTTITSFLLILYNQVLIHQYLSVIITFSVVEGSGLVFLLLWFHANTLQSGFHNTTLRPYARKLVPYQYTVNDSVHTSISLFFIVVFNRNWPISSIFVVLSYHIVGLSSQQSVHHFKL